MLNKISKAELQLQYKITIAENVFGNTVKPFWNWIECSHVNYCEKKKEEKIKRCLHNPKMLRCSAYLEYEGIKEENQ